MPATHGKVSGFAEHVLLHVALTGRGIWDRYLSGGHGVEAHHPRRALGTRIALGTSGAGVSFGSGSAERSLRAWLRLAGQ